MKKIALAAAALLLAVGANAQVGIVAGLTSTATNLNDAYTDIAKTQNVNQFHAGLVYNFGLPFGLSVQPGLVYNMKGETLKYQIASQACDIDTKTGYLEVPVRIAWGMDFGIVEPFVFAEPFLGYAITTETKTKFQSDAAQQIAEAAAKVAGTTLNTTKENRWVDRNRVSYGIGLGAGVKLIDRIALSVKYFWDLGPAFESESTSKSSISAKAMLDATKDQKCSGIAATVALYF